MPNAVHEKSVPVLGVLDNGNTGNTPMTASSETEMDPGVRVLREKWQARSLSVEDVQSFAKAHLLDRAGSRIESEVSMFREILAGKAHVFLLNLVEHLEEPTPANEATLLPAACAVLQFALEPGNGDIVKRVACALPRLLPMCSSADLQAPLLELCNGATASRAHPHRYILAPVLYTITRDRAVPPPHPAIAVQHSSMPTALSSSRPKSLETVLARRPSTASGSPLPPMSSGARRPSW